MKVFKKVSCLIISTAFIYFGNSFFLQIEADKLIEEKDFTVEIKGDVLWTKTDINLTAGDYIKFSATGAIKIKKWSFWGRDGYDYEVGPEGTYNYADKVANNSFPMPSARSGPIPCYSLIGKLNEEGSPFLVGNKCSLVAPEDGTLYLGINDFDVKDNDGAFNVNINISREKSDGFDLIDQRKIESTAVAEDGLKQIDNPKVLLIYIDGLNYDVLKEMIFTGYLPNIKQYFFDSGADFINSFTVFPASTFQAAGSTLSGMYLDMTGLKQEMFFDRENGGMDHFFKPFGPNSAARTMRPEIGGKIRNQRSKPLKLIYDFTADNELNYASTILPVQHQSPPKHVMKTIANSGYLDAHNVHFKLDKINGDYALQHVIKKKNDLMYVWLPGPDVAGHMTSRGLWGEGRRDLCYIDDIIGQIMDKLKREKVFGQTYRILYSDHGHLGGKYFINQSFDISNELFYKTMMVKDRKVSEEGGLGFNIVFAEDDRILTRNHPDCAKDYFMVSAVEGFGMVNIYLPYKSKYSGNMADPNNLYSLANYNLYPDTDNVNILERVLYFDKSESNQFPNKVSSKAVDLVILKLDEERVLVLKNNSSQAIIERKLIDKDTRSFVYKYRIVSNIEQDENGLITFDENDEDKTDPLEYLNDPYISNMLAKDPGWLHKYHTADEWLEVSVHSQYPDAVVQFSHFFLWDESIKNLEKRYIPDFVVTANKGWNFRSDGVASTDHGYPFTETMTIPLLIAGPNIKKGVIIMQPNRIVDILPTTLSLLNIDYDENVFDGKSVLEEKVRKVVVKKENDKNDSTEKERDDIQLISNNISNLQHNDSSLDNVAYHEYGQIERYISFPYSYSVPDLQEDESKGKHTDISIHDYRNSYDLHNVAADVKFTFDLSVFKICDDTMDLFIPGDRVNPIGASFDAGKNIFEKIPDNIGKTRINEFFDSLMIRNFSVADTLALLSGNPVNESNFHRVNSLIDWSQDVMGDMNKLLGAPIYKFKKGLIPGKHLNRYLIDYPQLAIESARRSLVEILGRAVFNSIFGIEYGVGKITNTFKGNKDSTTESTDHHHHNHNHGHDHSDEHSDETQELEIQSIELQVNADGLQE